MNKEMAATMSLANQVVLWAIRDATHPIGTYGIRPCDARDAKAFLLGGKDFDFYEPFLTEDVKKAAMDARSEILRTIAAGEEKRERAKKNGEALKKRRTEKRERIKNAIAVIKKMGKTHCASDIAKKLGVSAPQVYYYAKRNGLAVKKLAHAELSERRKKSAIARWAKEKAGGKSGGKKKNRPEA